MRYTYEVMNNDDLLKEYFMSSGRHGMADSWIQFAPYILLAFMLLMSVGKSLYTRKRRMNVSKHGALLSQISHSTLFSGTRLKTPGGLPVLHVISAASVDDTNAHSMYMVDLPFQAAAHLVGIPRQLGADVAIKVQKEHMEEVVLEGDYPRYFQLFTQNRHQSATRYMLDPKAMVFTIDFCQHFFWEIHDSTLYFTNHGLLPSLSIVDTFIREIRPALEVPNANLIHPAKLSYTKRNYRSIKCPLCQKDLVDNGSPWLDCPDDHGSLLTGKQLLSLRSEIVKKIDHPKPPSIGKRSHLTCPYCSSRMKPNLYQDTGIEIDICKACGYRWLDTHEFAPVVGRTKAQTKAQI